ncbi:hypothetical protein FHU38_003037 [Saccharomonospora amisosensis]|uniref:Uncharacterized protein n=1 Tax=Saccharomonospora amisosensis TaxID=1128677 RepID=A0A7X5UR48_9PSEU|nr:hypothetical protein [Saccharomonospora amisosensis]NIJ12693.1 hypothetical protein [Saccharomonospora amisosensis]
MSLSREVRWLPGGARIVAEARAELPQKNELCAAFTATVCLRAHGVRVIDQDEVASAAGSVLLDAGVPTFPPGEAGRADYRITLPRTSDPAGAGTSAAGVAHAVERLSGGALAAVPACGEWTVSALVRLLDAARQHSRVAVLANVDTACFAAHDTPQQALRDYLATGFPPLWTSRWRVGHFVLLVGWLTGPCGAILSVVDTYPSLGGKGVHLQPISNVVAALRREDAVEEGGVLLVVPEAEADLARRGVVASGLRVRLWDNGSPAPEHPPRT